MAAARVHADEAAAGGEASREPAPREALGPFLRQVAADEMRRSQDVYVTRPVFGVDLCCTQRLVYNLGEVKEARLGLDREDPHRDLVSAAFRLVRLRDLTRPNAPMRAPISVRERIQDAIRAFDRVSKELDATPEAARAEKGPVWKVSLDESFAAIERSITEYAALHRLCAVVVDTCEGDACEVAVTPKVRVTVRTNPSGGSVRVLPELVYLINSRNNVPIDEMKWVKHQDGQSVNLLGRYRYIAEWPSGERDENTFEVDEASTEVKFVPAVPRSQ